LANDLSTFAANRRVTPLYQGGRVVSTHASDAVKVTSYLRIQEILVHDQGIQTDSTGCARRGHVAPLQIRSWV